MSAVLTGSFEFDVPPGSWVCGPLLRRGETIRVQAGGVVRWGGLPTYVDGPDLVQDSAGNASYQADQSGAGVPWTLHPGGPGIGGITLAPGQSSRVLYQSTGFNAKSPLPDGDVVAGIPLLGYLGDGQGVTLSANNIAALAGLQAELTLTLQGQTIATTGLIPLTADRLNGDYRLPLGGETSVYGVEWDPGDVAALSWSFRVVNQGNASRSMTFYAAVATVHTGTPAGAGQVGTAAFRSAWASMAQAAPGKDWTIASDETSVSVSIGAGESSRQLTADPGDLVSKAVPPGWTIVGVMLTAETSLAGGNLQATLNPIVGGSPVGTTLGQSLTPGSRTLTIGGPSDTLGRAWTAEDLNSVSYRLDVASQDTNVKTFSVRDVTLTVWAKPSTTELPYAYPEGTYPPTFGPIGYGGSYGTTYPQGYDPTAVLRPEDWTGPPLLAPSVPPLGLAMIAAPDGPTPPFASRPDALGPGRDRAFSASDFSASQRRALAQGGRLRLWFAVNDAPSATTDTGGYSLRVERLLDTTMPDQIARTSLTAPRFGVQTGKKQRAAATFMLACIASNGLRFKPETASSKQTTAGVGVTVGQRTTSHSSTADVALTLDYVDSFRIAKDALAGEYSVTNLAAGVYRHTVVANAFKQNVPPRYTVENVGEPEDPVSVVLDVIFTGLKIQCDPGKLATCTSSAMGNKINYDNPITDPAWGTKGDPIAPTPGRNDVQVVAFVGGPTGGQMALEQDGVPSGSFGPTSTASQVQTAIRSLPGRSTDTVAGSVGGPFTVTNLSGTVKSLLVPNYTALDWTSTLTGGTDPSATVTHQTKGGFAMGDLDEVTDAQAWYLRLADSWDDVENGGAGLTLDANWSTDITIAERMKREWIQKGAGVFNYGLKAPGDLTDSAKLSMGLTPDTRAFLVDAQNDVRKCLRIQADGDEIGETGFARSIRIDMDGQLSWDDETDVENARSMDLTLTAHYNLETGHFLAISWVNEVPSYA